MKLALRGRRLGIEICAGCPRVVIEMGAMQCAQCSIQSVMSTVQCAQSNVHSVICTVQNAHCNVHSVMCKVHCTQCAICNNVHIVQFAKLLVVSVKIKLTSLIQGRSCNAFLKDGCFRMSRFCFLLILLSIISFLLV